MRPLPGEHPSKKTCRNRQTACRSVRDGGCGERLSRHTHTLEAYIRMEKLCLNAQLRSWDQHTSRLQIILEGDRDMGRIRDMILGYLNVYVAFTFLYGYWEAWV